jgi:hypothetical protein
MGLVRPALEHPALTEPALTEPALTEPALTEPALTEPALIAPALTSRGGQLERTTVTGQAACVTQCMLTEPSSMPLKAPCP